MHVIVKNQISIISVYEWTEHLMLFIFLLSTTFLPEFKDKSKFFLEWEIFQVITFFSPW